MTRRLFQWLAVLAILVPAIAQAQGVLVVVDPNEHVRLPRPGVIIWPPHPRPIPIPRPAPEPPPATYKIDELEVNTRIVGQVAQVQVSQSFVNTGSRVMEVAFIFPLPYEGAVDRMTLMVDGKEYAAKLMDAKEARRIYEEIVRKNRDPALLEWVGTGMFKTSVFPVPPGAKRTVSLRYSQLCRKDQGLTDFLFPLSTAKYTSQPVEKINIRATIESQEDIKNVYSPTHAVNIQRPDDKHATVTYSVKNDVPSSDFRLFYDIGKGKVSMKVLSYRSDKDHDGYFLLLASPEIKPSDGERPKKTVIFAIDRSGSMSGKKIEQVQAALKDVLNKLREGDTFNIVAYDSEVESFRPELQKYDEKTRKSALGFVEGLYAGGSTNIDGALRTAFGQLTDSSRPSYVLFLTDGIPTTGETNELKIIANAKQQNKVHGRLFVFGVGHDLNARFLDRLASQQFGQTEYVRPNENIEEHVARLYNRIESPVLTGVQIKFDFDAKAEEASPVNRFYPKDSFDLFAGEQLVVVGRYRKPGTAKVVVTGKMGDKTEKFDFAATFVDKSKDESFGFIEKLWAMRRVGEILEELDLKGKNDELIKELVGLSTRHGIMTPYTSFMADDSAPGRDMAFNLREANRRLDALSVTGGAGGVEQRAFKGDLQRAQTAPAAPAAEAMGRFAMSGARRERLAAESANGGARLGGAPRARPSAGAMPADEAAKDLDFGDKLQKEAESAEKNVRNLGNRTFYRRGNQWVDSQVTKVQEQNAKRVKQFSDDYFKLADRYGRTMSQYLAFDEPVMLNLEGQAYLIEP
jgi:Ca-activated chloride channel family protein